MQLWYNPEPMIVTRKISKEELVPLLIRHKKFIKVVVDIEMEILAAGGALHADDEKVLLENGSLQENLWGANYYPRKNEIEYKSMINIRPRDGNSSQEIKNEEIKEAVKRIVLQLLGP